MIDTILADDRFSLFVQSPVEHGTEGMIIMDRKDLDLFLQDELQFFADHYKTDKDTILAWIKWIDDRCPCTGKTRAGKPCKAGADDGYGGYGSSFVPGDTDRCRVHKANLFVDRVCDPNCHQSDLENVAALLDT